MRFAAVIQPKPQPARVPTTAELLRRLVSGEQRSGATPPPPRFLELPADLDQRVRLVGEW